MAATARVALGLDFGTESVRALLVDLEGHERGSAVVPYAHGQIIDKLPTSREPLPPDFALQDPQDWIASSSKAVKQALQKARLEAKDVLSIGVDFTSCTMLPTLADGTPLCSLKKFAAEKFAWPKLWKHHGAKSQTDRINRLATARDEPWLARYGGVIGLEWFFPKVLETFERAPAVYRAAEVWLEAGDWFVWQLVGGPAKKLPRSTCQAGYKAMWSAAEGYPSRRFFTALEPTLSRTLFEKLPGQFISPGEAAGELLSSMASKLGLRPGIAVSAAVIDAHAGVPGAGVAGPDTLVMVLGTSSCHMLNSEVERMVPGVSAVVQGGILPGMYGYETGQAAVGDAFDWMRRLAGQSDFKQLDARAAEVLPGSEGLLAIDWLNGCRTPLMDGSLTGSFFGLALRHGPEHLYRALMEASACGLRWIVELLTEGGVPIKKYVATGGLPHHNPLLVQIYADVLGQPICIAPSKQGPALGAAILGVLAAGSAASGFKSPAGAIRAMARSGQRMRVVKPNRPAKRALDELYNRYRARAESVARSLP